MAKIDLPENWESEDDTVFMESEPGGLFVGVFLLIFAGVFGLPVLESVSYVSVDPYEDPIGVFGVLIFSLLSVTFAVFGLKSIWNSRVVWRWEINLADKRFMLKKIRGSQTKVRWDRDLGGGAVLKIMESGDDNFTIRFEGPDWKETLWHHSWGYSRTRAFAESLSDAIGIEIVDERRRGISEDSETWWEEKVEHDSEPEERMDMRMATRDPDAQIDESVVGGHVRLKGNSKMLHQTLAFVVFGIFFLMWILGAGGDVLAGAEDPVFYVGFGLFFVIVFLCLMFVGYLFLTKNGAWTSVTIHDDKLVFGRLASTRIDSVTYKEVPKTSISAIRLERIWHEDNDDHDH